MPKRIFIAATRQNDGKTTTSLGLISAFKKRFKRIGFIKPIGQRYLIEQGYKVDEDSVLIGEVCNIECNLKDMSPVAIEKGFTEKYIQKPDKEAITSQIKSSFARVAKSRSLVVIEGTGHAGVGSCFDSCNAEVARLLGSKAVIVTSGGIGRPIDEIMLNTALFEKKGVEVIGVIINKVAPAKYKKIDRLIRKGLKQKGLKVFGVLPFAPSLSAPTVQQISETLDAKIISGEDGLYNAIEHILIGAMGTHEALKHITDKSMIITGGDREDLILAAMSSEIYGMPEHSKLSGIVLTGGIKPHRAICALLKKAGIPTLLVKDDTYTAAKKIHDRTVKIRPEDKDKIRDVSDLIEEYVDVEGILSAL